MLFFFVKSKYPMKFKAEQLFSYKSFHFSFFDMSVDRATRKSWDFLPAIPTGPPKPLPLQVELGDSHIRDSTSI